jgi:hypothetical protein
MSRITVAVIVAAVVLCACTAVAQVGTWNIPSASAWDNDDAESFVEGRWWDGDNTTWGAFVRGQFDDNGEAIVGYFDWDALGEDPINGAVRRTDYSAVVVDLKCELTDGSPVISLRAGADLEGDDGRGQNTAMGGSAFTTGTIPVFSLPIEFGNPAGTLLILEPKVIFFDTQMPTNVGPPIEGFGTTIMIGGGVRYPISGSLTAIADAAYPVNDSNSIDDTTNEVTEELVWSAGVSADLGGDWTGDVFATTAAGPTPATSSIATPDQSVGVGVRVGKSW